MWLSSSQAAGERKRIKGHLEIVPLLLSLFWQNWWEEKGTVGIFVPSVHGQLAPIWRPLLSGWMGCFLAGLNHQGFLLLGGRVEPPFVTPSGPSLASSTSSTRRAALLKCGQNINCGYPWGVRLHMRPNTLLFHILYLIFIYNEHMT